jgi:opacity protein-like surface antigen
MISKRLFAAAVLCMFFANPAISGGKVGIYGTYMTPYGSDAKDFSRAGWGGGIHAVFPVQPAQNLFAGVVGLEAVNLMSQTDRFRDPRTGLRTEQQTTQNYFRLYLGAEIGPHGNGFLRPHAGINLAGILYNISTDVVVPDDYDHSKDIHQSVDSKTKTVFGYDITLGLDLNFSNTISVDGGVKYLKSFSVPQQLGEGSVTVHPQYFQIYLGVGVSFDFISNLGD